MKRWKENSCNSKMAIRIWDKTDFKLKAVKKNKEGYYITIKGSIQEEVIIF